MSPFEREARGSESDSEEKTTEAEVREETELKMLTTGFEYGEKGHEPRNV